MDAVNDITLQILLNQKNYSKVLKNRNKKEDDDDDENDDKKIQHHKAAIITIVENLIDERIEDYSNEIIHSFDGFVKEIFKHWEMLKVKENNKFNTTTIEKHEEYGDSDEDTIFGNVEDVLQQNTTQSFWSSEKIKKV